MYLVSERKVDQLGRVVLPKELRKKLSIEYKTALNIYVDDQGQIVLRKNEAVCVVCASSENIILLREGCSICSKCVEDIVRRVALSL